MDDISTAFRYFTHLEMLSWIFYWSKWEHKNVICCSLRSPL